MSEENEPYFIRCAEDACENVFESEKPDSIKQYCENHFFHYELDIKDLRIKELEMKIADLECRDPKCNPLEAKIERLESELAEAKRDGQSQWKMKNDAYNSMLKSMEHEKALEARLSLMQEAIEMAIRVEKDECVPAGYLKKLKEALSSVAVEPKCECQMDGDVCSYCTNKRKPSGAVEQKECSCNDVHFHSHKCDCFSKPSVSGEEQ